MNIISVSAKKDKTTQNKLGFFDLNFKVQEGIITPVTKLMAYSMEEEHILRCPELGINKLPVYKGPSGQDAKGDMMMNFRASKKYLPEIVKILEGQESVYFEFFIQEGGESLFDKMTDTTTGEIDPTLKAALTVNQRAAEKQLEEMKAYTHQPVQIAPPGRISGEQNTGAPTVTIDPEKLGKVLDEVTNKINQGAINQGGLKVTAKRIGRDTQA